MKNVTGVFQNEGALVFKLKETGAFKRGENGQLVPELTNEVSFLVQVDHREGEPGAACAMRQIFEAEKIVKILNQNLEN